MKSHTIKVYKTTKEMLTIPWFDDEKTTDLQMPRNHDLHAINCGFVHGIHATRLKPCFVLF